MFLLINKDGTIADAISEIKYKKFQLYPTAEVVDTEVSQEAIAIIDSDGTIYSLTNAIAVVGSDGTIYPLTNASVFGV